MTTEPKLDKAVLAGLIRAAEMRNGHRLNIDDFDFLMMAVESFVTAAIDKFIAGSKEHSDDSGSFVETVNHKQEIQKEILDLWMYAKGMERKKL